MSEATTTVERWVKHFNAGDGEAVARLYTPDALLWGTLSRDITASPDNMRAYFIEAARLGLTVKLGVYAARSFAPDIAAIAGHYDLFRSLDGRQTLFAARYSIVLVRQRAEWLIAQHHSSLMPATGAAFIR
ncbi:MAG TPA: SgcJ/EcaC family oxidoreductase [Afipia sp.]